MPIQLTRDEKCINMTKNMAIITSTVMTISMTAAIADVVKKFGQALGGAIVSGVNPNELKKWNEAYAENTKKIPQDILAEVKNTKKQFDEQQRSDPEGLRRFVSNPVFDEGVKIVEKYDLPLPKITEPIDETALSFYVSLVLADDKQVGPMFKELMELSNRIPPPG